MLLVVRERERERESKREVLVKDEDCGIDVKNGKKKEESRQLERKESQKVNFYELVLAFRFDLYSFVYFTLIWNQIK